MTAEDPKRLPPSLRSDAPDVALPAFPSDGFRNMFGTGAAHASQRYQGLGCSHRTVEMLQQLAMRMMDQRSAPQEFLPAGLTYLLQLVSHDLQFSGVLPPQAIAAGTRLRERRLVLETIYGPDDPRDAALYESDGGTPGWKLKLRRFAGPGDQWKADLCRDAKPSKPDLPLTAADERNDANLIVAQTAGHFMRLHNVAFDRLSAISSPEARFAAARLVTRSVYRRIAFEQLLAKLLHETVRQHYEAEKGFLDRSAFDVDAIPVEFSHAAIRFGHALVRAHYEINPLVMKNTDKLLLHTSKHSREVFRQNRGWAIDWKHFYGDAPQKAQSISPFLNQRFAEFQCLAIPKVEGATDRMADLILRDLARGADGGVLTVDAISRQIRNGFTPASAQPGWLAVNSCARSNSVAEWIGDHAPLAPFKDRLTTDPPLFFFVLLEAAADPALGGGGGRSLGVLGSVLISEVLYSARAQSRNQVEDDSERESYERTVFETDAPSSMEDLLEVLKQAP